MLRRMTGRCFTSPIVYGSTMSSIRIRGLSWQNALVLRSDKFRGSPGLLSQQLLLSSLQQMRSYSIKHSQEKAVKKKNKNENEHDQSISSAKDERHTHSHSTLGHSHTHGEDEHGHGHGHGHDPEQILAALKGSGDRGSQITLIGLFSNVILTSVKGFAGWYMHSASLLADAGHSLSDLLGDFVTLFCWRLSRKPPSERYPYGFAKFETLGTTTISILLIGGALGIGFHSYHLLVVTLSEAAVNLSPGPLQDILQFVTSSAPLPKIGHEHVHTVDPHAAWFAAVSVLTKEWLYRITKVVADEEKSPVLLANAIHHRSDAYSSVVAFFAILGTWVFPAFPLDPIGGLLVSMIILRQAFDLLKGAWGDLTDAGVSPRTRQSLLTILKPLVDKSTTDHHDPNFLNSSPLLLSIQHLRARHSGSLMFVDLIAEVSGSVTVAQASTLDEKITRTLKEAKKEITEVRVTFKPRSSCKESMSS